MSVVVLVLGLLSDNGLFIEEAFGEGVILTFNSLSLPLADTKIQTGWLV